MLSIPDIDVNELRRIADTHWDALTSRSLRATRTDRYDRFLVRGAELLRQGASEARVGDYFVDVAIERLGVDTGSGIRERAQLFARAIRDYLESLEMEASSSSAG